MIAAVMYFRCADTFSGKQREAADNQAQKTAASLQKRVLASQQRLLCSAVQGGSADYGHMLPYGPHAIRKYCFSEPEQVYCLLHCIASSPSRGNKNHFPAFPEKTFFPLWVGHPGGGRSESTLPLFRPLRSAPHPSNTSLVLSTLGRSFWLLYCPVSPRVEVNVAQPHPNQHQCLTIKR